MKIKYKPIGIIHTPFKSKKGMPIQSAGAEGIKGTINIKKKYVPGLSDLDGFSHIILIYHFHKSSGYELKTIPFLDTEIRGVFSTRAPKRPNQIGISIVKLLKTENNILEIENIDILDNTPLLDIKPYIPEFDFHKNEKAGWLSNKIEKINTLKSDNRFK